MRQHGGRGGGAVGVKQGRGAYAAPAYASVLCGTLRVRMEGATYPGRTEHPRGRALAQRFSRHAEDVFSAAGRRADADPRDAAGAGDAAGIALERAAVEGALSRYTAQGVADSTRRSYASGLRWFERFCEQLGFCGGSGYARLWERPSRGRSRRNRCECASEKKIAARQG